MKTYATPIAFRQALEMGLRQSSGGGAGRLLNDAPQGNGSAWLCAGLMLLGRPSRLSHKV